MSAFLRTENQILKVKSNERTHCESKEGVRMVFTNSAVFSLPTSLWKTECCFQHSGLAKEQGGSGWGAGKPPEGCRHPFPGCRLGLRVWALRRDGHARRQPALPAYTATYGAWEASWPGALPFCGGCLALAREQIQL